MQTYKENLADYSFVEKPPNPSLAGGLQKSNTRGWPPTHMSQPRLPLHIPTQDHSSEAACEEAYIT